jgi:hypothetical protein
MRLSDVGACGAGAFAVRHLGTRDQACVGGTLLHAGEAVEIMDGVAEHKARGLADAGHGVPQMQGGSPPVTLIPIICNGTMAFLSLSLPATHAGLFPVFLCFPARMRLIYPMGKESPPR